MIIFVLYLLQLKNVQKRVCKLDTFSHKIDYMPKIDINIILSKIYFDLFYDFETIK